MKRITILVVLLILMLTSCQQTPEREIVTSKSDNLVEQVQEANSAENTDEQNEYIKIIQEQIININGHITMEIDTVNPLTNIIIDADVISPDYNKIPLVRVKPVNFTKEEFENFADIMTGGLPLYMKFPSNSSITWLTKEEIEVILPELKACALNNDLDSITRKWLNNAISSMESDYSYALRKSDDVPYDGELTTIENNKKYITSTNLKAYMGRTQAAWLQLSQSKNSTSTSMSIRNNDYAFGYNTLEEYKGIDAEKIDISYEEALKIATDTLHKLDGEDTNLSLVGSSIGYSVGYFYDYTKETSPQVYGFGFCRTYNGIPVKSINYLYNTSDNINYTQEVKPEIFSFMIDNDGVCYSNWRNKTEYIETVADDTPLLDFESIQEIFENQLRYQFEWVPTGDTCPDGLGATITIKSIELNLMVTAEKDSIETYLVVPVWDLIGDVKYSDIWIGPEGLEQTPPENVSVLTINAINGSVINREQGY